MRFKIKDAWHAIKENFVLEWVFVITIALVMLISFYYLDFRSLTIWSTNFWEVISQGDITQYFAYTAQNVCNAPHKYVSGTLYSLIAWGIWNLPIWGIQHFLGIPILSNTFMLIWSELFLVIALLLVIKTAKKIINFITTEKGNDKLTGLLIASSVWIFIGVFYAGQNDIIICLLGLIAMYALMKNKQKTFLILSGFAISVKYFFLFPFIALLLLTEKNTYKIIGKGIIALIPTLVFNLVCRNFPMFNASEEQGPFIKMLSSLFVSDISGFRGVKISLFVISLLFVYFMAYVTKPEKEEKNKFITYITAVSFVPLLAFTKIEFYRMILIIPFLIIVLMQNRKLLKVNLILENILEVSTLFVIILKSGFIFAPANVKLGYLPKILGFTNQNVSSLGEHICRTLPITKTVLPAFSALCVGTMILLFIINHPRFNQKHIEVQDQTYERWWLWIRPVTIFTCVLGMFYLMR